MIDMAHNVSLDEMLEEVLGPVGSPKRDRFDRESARYIKAEKLASRFTRHLGPVGAGWYFAWDASTQSARPSHVIAGMVDGLSFHYLGDFMFHGQPITQDYADSWLSRVHLPAWMRASVRWVRTYLHGKEVS